MGFVGKKMELCFEGLTSDECYEVELDSHEIYMGKLMRIVMGPASS